MDIGTIENMIGEHPFGISDSAIDEIVTAVKEYAQAQFALGFVLAVNVRPRQTAADNVTAFNLGSRVGWNAGFNDGWDAGGGQGRLRRNP